MGFHAVGLGAVLQPQRTSRSADSHVLCFPEGSLYEIFFKVIHLDSSGF
jgi:hypothetical protein